eukprot:TRINITY_DN93521_c0_g1_i1.p1 TRINITY_DN93521_c0_g1~~TRINITY_DN93521_c0_g1_i1.p1  ORF type:complete len:137 (-),score=20.17 TRINITY_DN93521_c0_g1_i1:171-581(-)
MDVGRLPQCDCIANTNSSNFELPVGSVRRGQAAFKKYCSQCHSAYPDNSNLQNAPNLWAVYGRAPGQNKDNDAKKSSWVWDSESLMRLMRKPHHGKVIDDMQARVDVIHYLQTLTPERQRMFHICPESFYDKLLPW